MAKHTSPGLSFLYHTAAGRFLLKGLTAPPVSRLVGRYLDSRLSRIHIAGFVRRNGIDLAGCEKQSFSSFNDCFTRTLRPDQRPVNMDPNALISPCDGLLSVFPIEPDRVFAVKGSRYTLSELLGGSEIAGQYGGGLCLIFRLCVGDYHRYCYMDWAPRGKPLPARRPAHRTAHCPGQLPRVHTKLPGIYRPQHRTFRPRHPDRSGRPAGGPHSKSPGAGVFQKGQEKGLFLYGGSTVLLLLEPNRVRLLPELLAQCQAGQETSVRQGQTLGYAI